MNAIAPSLFVSHGSPMLPFEPSVARDFIQSLGQLYSPRAIICISAHWETDEPRLCGALRPETLHDFYNFPPFLYNQQYSVSGDPDLAAKASGLLHQAGIQAHIDVERGLDHGAWVPLMLMYPQANIPIVQLSVQPMATPESHWRIGRALRELRHEGVLILGSGGATHNLRDLRAGDENAPVAYAADFDHWLRTSVINGDEEALLDYLNTAPEAKRNHPTPEHYLPLTVALGAAYNLRGEVIHRSFSFGILSMSAFAWD